MKKRTGKMISLSLAVAMAVTAAPVTALAVDEPVLTTAQNAGETGTDTTTEKDVLKSNDAETLTGTDDLDTTSDNTITVADGSEETLQKAIEDANDGDKILVTKSITLTKPVIIDKGITLEAESLTPFVVDPDGNFNEMGDNHVFRLSHKDAVLDNITLTLEEGNTTPLNIVYVSAGTVQDCWLVGSGATDNPVTRGVMVESGAKNVTITGNHFEDFFASAYINSGATGDIIDNESKNTEESWCIADGSNMDLTGNTFEGTTTIDIKIFADSPIQTNNYTKEKFLAMSENNSSAHIQNEIDGVTALDGSIIVSDKDSLEKAIEYADATETPIALQAVITGDFVIDANKNVSLDLNGHKITNESDHTITNNGTLTIKDSSEGKTGTITNSTHGKGALVNNYGGTVDIESGTLTREEAIGNSWYVISNGGTMNIKGGSIINKVVPNDNPEKTLTSSLIRNEGDMDISGGYLEHDFIAVKNDDTGTNLSTLIVRDNAVIESPEQAIQNWTTAVISGGTMNGKVSTWGYKGQCGNTEITGGTINGNITIGIDNSNLLNSSKIPEVTISNGTINGDIEFLTGGTSTAAPENTKGSFVINNGVTINGDVKNPSAGTVEITDATVTGTVSNTGSGSMAVIESKVGGYSPEQTITFVDSTTTNGETIKNTQDVSAACARIGAKYYNTLEEALTKSESDDTITLVKDVTVSNTQDMANSNYNEAVITLKDGVTLDGDTHTIYASESWVKSTDGNNIDKPANHIVGVSGVSATIKNLTIVGNENTKHGINAFGTNGTNTLIVNNVTIKNCGTAGMVIKGAKVTATNINTEGNAWGAINVDKSTGSTLDLTGGTFKEAAQIWTEADGTNVTLDGVQLDKVTGKGENLKGYTYFTDDVSKLGAAYNETTRTIYESLAEALTAAQSRETISVVKDTELATDAAVAEGVTLVVNPDVTLSIAEGKTLTNNGTIENKGEIEGTVKQGTTGEVTKYYTVTFTSNKEIKSVEVQDENDATVEPNVEGKFIYSLKDGKYTYTMETVRGTRNGSFTVDGKELTINERFSSGGGSSHSYDGYITIINPKNGEVSVSDDWAYEDEKITLTITPDKGYVVDKIEIVDDEGDKINAKKVEDKDDKYTFRMANCDVTVTVTFKEEGKTTEDTDKEEDKDDEETTELNFTDVKESDWFFKGVEYVVDKDIMSGVSENEFAPSGKLTRAMLVQMLYNMESRPACDAENAFMDVPVGQWYTDAVIWANDAKIVSGMGEGLFAPNMEITREQMVAMLYNYAKYKGYDVTASADLSAFADTASVSAWAQPAMQWAVAEGYISGMGDSQLAPQGTATRAEIASVIMRFMEATAESAETAE